MSTLIFCPNNHRHCLLRRLQDVNFARHGILYLYVCHLYCRTHHCFQSSMLLVPMEIPWKSLRFPTANDLTQTQLCVAQAPSQLFAALVEPDVVPWGHDLVTASPATHRPIQVVGPPRKRSVGEHNSNFTTVYDTD